MSERVESLLERVLGQLERQTLLLEDLKEANLLLVQALAEEGQDPDAEPMTYMDGSKVS